MLTDVRPIECERIKSTLTSKWNGTLWVAEDTAMLDTSMDIVTSRDVRQKLKENQPVRHLVGGLIDEYFKKHLIGAKVCTLPYQSVHYIHLRDFNFALSLFHPCS